MSNGTKSDYVFQVHERNVLKCIDTLWMHTICCLDVLASSSQTWKESPAGGGETSHSAAGVWHVNSPETHRRRRRRRRRRPLLPGALVSLQVYGFKNTLSCCVVWTHLPILVDYSGNVCLRERLGTTAVDCRETRRSWKTIPLLIFHRKPGPLYVSFSPRVFTSQRYKVPFSSANRVNVQNLRVFSTFSPGQTFGGPPRRRVFPPRRECPILCARVTGRWGQGTYDTIDNIRLGLSK